jgi:hypothetical protein
MESMWKYVVTANYVQLKDSDHNNGAAVYIDGRPKESGNIEGLINNTRPRTTRKKPNCIFEGHEGNRKFICVVKTIVVGEELLVDYDFNRNDGITAIVGVNMFYQYTKHVINVFLFIYLT